MESNQKESKLEMMNPATRKRRNFQIKRYFIKGKQNAKQNNLEGNLFVCLQYQQARAKYYKNLAISV